MPEITPGTTVSVEVTKKPSSVAAQKTVVRLLSKDADVIKRNQNLARSRNANPIKVQRGGRVRAWSTRHPKLDIVDAVPGTTATFIAGYQELRDLASVERFVKISKA